MSIVVTYLITREFFDRKTGLISAFIFSLSPIHLYLSSVILADTTSFFFALLSAYTFIKFKKTRNPAHLHLCAVFTSFAVMTRYAYWSLIAIYALIEVLSFVKSSGNFLKFWFRKTTITAFLIFILFFTPQMRYNQYHFGNPFKPGYLDQVSEFKNTLSIKNAYTTGHLRQTPSIILFPHILLFRYNILPPYLILFIALGAALMLKEKKRNELLFISAWFTVFSTVNLMYLHNIYLIRYSLPLIFPLSLLGGYGVVKTCSIFRKKEARVFITAFLLLYSTTMIFGIWLKEDRIKMHKLEEDTYWWLNHHTEEESKVFYAATFTNPIAQRELQREVIYIYGLNETTIKESIKNSSHTYFVIAQDGNDRTKNGLPLFYEIKDDFQLTILKQEKIRLSMMSPWRSYTLKIYTLSIPESGP